VTDAPETGPDAKTDTAPEAGAKRRRRWLPFASPLTWRILAVNVLAPVILVGGLFYLDRYKNELIAQELESLRIRAEIMAAAVGEGGVIDTGFAIPELSPTAAKQMVRRLAQPARMRARLFDDQGNELADSKILMAGTTEVLMEDLPEPDRGLFVRGFRKIYNFVTQSSLADEGLPRYRESPHPKATDYPEVVQALNGDAAWAVRAMRGHRLLLTTAVPVQHYKQVLGAVMVSSSGDDIAQSLFKVRLTIFQAFAFALTITIGLSVYLAGTIARPVRRLAAAADRVRRGHGRRHTIPDLSKRGDEIGELSGSLREMTETLWRRMDAVEAFAADVAHEIKNPLTSLRSAVETCARIQNPDQQRRLMAIIQDDVGRLDRLISDISDASRIDAELSRADSEPVSLCRMVEGLASIYQDTGAAEGVSITVECLGEDPLLVMGIESRLAQVLRNLISNALSFSPPQGHIVLQARRENGKVVATVEDEGPGIPENKLDAIFDRFYTERPAAEKFGTHSGLGLSISKQIAEAHGGSLSAINRIGPEGQVLGARFIFALPAYQPQPEPGAKRQTGKA
jgi:two-component system sensor histidine kinase ChvG